jgi:hypothetical protein
MTSQEAVTAMTFQKPRDILMTPLSTKKGSPSAMS